MAGSIAERLREVALSIEKSPELIGGYPCRFCGFDPQRLADSLRSLAGEIEEAGRYLREAAGNTLRRDDLMALPGKVEHVASRLAAPEVKPSLDDLERDFVRALASYWGEPNTAGIHDTTTAAARALVAALDADEPCEYAPGNSFCLAHQKVHRAAPSEPSPATEAPWYGVGIPDEELRDQRDKNRALAAKIDAMRGREDWLVELRRLRSLAHLGHTSHPNALDAPISAWESERRAHEEMAERVRRVRAMFLNYQNGQTDRINCKLALAILEGRDKEPTSK